MEYQKKNKKHTHMNIIKKIVVLAVVLCTISLHAMKRPRPQKLQENDQKKQALKKEPFDFFFLDQQQIVPFSTIIHESRTIIIAASAFDSLSRTNKALNEYFNKRSVMLNLVKHISTHFNQSNQYTARILSIKTANEIHDAQELLYAYMYGAQENPQYVMQPLSRLASTMGVDVNYTYRRNQQTPLAIILKEPYQCESKTRIIDWLINHGASIAPITKDRDSAASIALYRNNFASLDKFLSHKDFNPNYIGKNGNTLLHDCLIILQRKKQSSRNETTFLRKVNKIKPIILHLLGKKIDVSIANHDEKTPLMLAKRLSYDSITILLELENAETTAISM